MSSESEKHNQIVAICLREIVKGTQNDKVQSSIIMESLLAGVAMACYPANPRIATMLIQEISDGAQDRVRKIR